jgi:hypothetical protein
MTVVWTQNATQLNLPMGRFECTLKTPLSCDELFLDQVYILFKPSSTIPLTTFQDGDGIDKTWRAETRELAVRVRPGMTYQLYSRADTLPEQSAQATLEYSTILEPVPTGQAPEELWCRTYQPLRDVPVARGYHSVGQITLELLWPCLEADNRTTFTHVPDYRIEKVICNLSWR